MYHFELLLNLENFDIDKIKSKSKLFVKEADQYRKSNNSVIIGEKIKVYKFMNNI